MTFKEMWNDVPKPLQIIVYTILGVVAAVGFGLLFGWIIVWLWNWLMPMIFGLPTITFWQGVGIFILAKILFGGFSSHSDSSSKSDKKKHKGNGNHCFDWDSDKGMGKFSRWEHYDEWWKAEGKDAFQKYAAAADEDPDEPAPEDEPKQTEE